MIDPNEVDGAIHRLLDAVTDRLGAMDLCEGERLTLPGILSLDAAHTEERGGETGLHYRVIVWASVVRGTTEHACWPFLAKLPPVNAPRDGREPTLADLELLADNMASLEAELTRVRRDMIDRANRAAAELR